MDRLESDAEERWARVCPWCGYDLKGIECVTCPECGGKVDPESLADLEREALAKRGELIGGLFLASGLQALLATVADFADGALLVAVRCLLVVPLIAVIVVWYRYVKLGRFLSPDGNPGWAEAIGNGVLLVLSILGLYAFAALILLAIYVIRLWLAGAA